MTFKCYFAIKFHKYAEFKPWDESTFCCRFLKSKMNAFCAFTQLSSLHSPHSLLCRWVAFPVGRVVSGHLVWMHTRLAL